MGSTGSACRPATPLRGRSPLRAQTRIRTSTLRASERARGERAIHTSTSELSKVVVARHDVAVGRSDGDHRLAEVAVLPAHRAQVGPARMSTTMVRQPTHGWSGNKPSRNHAMRHDTRTDAPTQHVVTTCRARDRRSHEHTHIYTCAHKARHSACMQTERTTAAATSCRAGRP